MTTPWARGVRRRRARTRRPALRLALAGVLVALVSSQLAGCAPEPLDAGEAQRTRQQMEELTAEVISAVEAYGAEAGVALQGWGTGYFHPCGMMVEGTAWTSRINIEGFSPLVSREAPAELRGLRRALRAAGLRPGATDDPGEIRVDLPSAFVLVGRPLPVSGPYVASAQYRTISVVGPCRSYAEADAEVLEEPDSSYDVAGVVPSR